jgi:hypothetical protein
VFYVVTSDAHRRPASGPHCRVEVSRDRVPSDLAIPQPFANNPFGDVAKRGHSLHLRRGGGGEVAGCCVYRFPNRCFALHRVYSLAIHVLVIGAVCKHKEGRVPASVCRTRLYVPFPPLQAPVSSTLSCLTEQSGARAAVLYLVRLFGTPTAMSQQNVKLSL